MRIVERSFKDIYGLSIRKLSALYYHKDNRKVVAHFLPFFLMQQFYSPEVLRQAKLCWKDLPFWAKAGHDKAIVELMDKIDPQMDACSEKLLRYQINKYLVERAVRVLNAYKNCPVPMTTDSHIPVFYENLLSQKGEQALALLKQGQTQGKFTDAMAQLAMKTTSKSLLDLRYFRLWNINRSVAKNLCVPVTPYKNEKFKKMYPTIQLTSGCQNHCSHCCSRAEPHLAHMPYPMFLALHHSFQRYYPKAPQPDFYAFSNFFSDSDMLSYHDSIIGADSGDVALRLIQNRSEMSFLTRGVTDDASKVACAKASFGTPILLSFVDTPKENIDYNIRQLHQTLDVLKETHMPVAPISHLHLKNGPVVSSGVFCGAPIEDTVIFAMGRAKQFSKDEILCDDDSAFLVPTLIRPNGDVVFTKSQDGEHVGHICNNIFGHKTPVKDFIPVNKLYEAHR